MNIAQKLTIALGTAGLLATAGLVWAQRIKDLPPVSRGVNMPQLSPQAVQGQRVFDANCAQCHGQYGLGTDKGPPLLNAIYNPGHHPDEAFVRAVRQGVRQHHWRFGNMAALPEVNEDDVLRIVRYVRELQEANGIKYEAHSM